MSELLETLNELQTCLEETHQDTLKDELEDRRQMEPDCSYCRVIVQAKQQLRAAGVNVRVYHTMEQPA